MTVLRRCLILAFVCLQYHAASAADLRVSLSELASLLNPMLAGTRIRLHNAPPNGILGAIFDPAQTSFVRFADNEVPLEIPPTTFPLTGIGTGLYAYYLNDISSRAITVEPANGSLRLTIQFEDKDAELVGACFSGTCGFSSALPIVHWLKPQISVDLTPDRFQDGITLSASNLRVAGYFKTTCQSGSVLCAVGKSSAERYINHLRQNVMPGQILALLNSEANRTQIATQLATYLKLGSTGKVSIVNLSIADRIVRVSFKLP